MLIKDKLIKWIKEEIYGCSLRKETERENAMRELLLKIERGYFDEEVTDIEIDYEPEFRTDKLKG